jgi:hypothetical protein
MPVVEREQKASTCARTSPDERGVHLLATSRVVARSGLPVGAPHASS